ncbi:MAG: hypothetical protein NTW96_18920 [Planctomycetia bacterium]|nr:hypothetical protein [Planctomycetia bacterium]
MPKPKKTRKKAETQNSRKSAHKKPGAGETAEEDSRRSKWVVVVLEAAKKEGHKILTDLQYDHIVDVLKRLVDFGNPAATGDLDIKPIRSFHELREKGGILGRINLRVYFGVVSEEGELVVAKVYKKEDDGPTPRHVVVLVEDRLETYKEGGLRKAATAYQETTRRR